MRLNVGFNEIAPYGPFVALIKGGSSYMAEIAIVATRICSESAVCSGSATVVGTVGDTVLEVRVLLS